MCFENPSLGLPYKFGIKEGEGEIGDKDHLILQSHFFSSSFCFRLPSFMPFLFFGKNPFFMFLLFFFFAFLSFLTNYKLFKLWRFI